MKLPWKAVLLGNVIAASLLACSTPPTRASNTDLEGYRAPAGSSSQASGGQSSDRPSSSQSNAGQSSAARPSTDTSGASRPAAGETGSSTVVHGVRSIDDLAEWYRPLFASNNSFVMQWDIDTQDEEIEGVNHREMYTTNCVLEPIGQLEGMIARRLSCDNDQEDFFQGYYVAVHEGVWLLDRLPRSLEQFRRLMSEGEIYEEPLLPATPREGARSMRDGDQSLVFSMQESDDGGWCRRFSIPSATRAYEYLYCIDRNGAIARAAYGVTNGSRTIREVNYRQWTGRLQ